MASPFQPYSPHLQMQRPSSDSWGDAPQMHVLPSSEVTCGPGYPDAHFFPSSVSAPTFPPTYPQWTPTDDSMYHSPHTAVVSPPHAAGFGSPSIPPPMQSHDPHHPTYSPLAYALPEWFSSSRHNTVPGISVSSPVPQTDSSGFIYPPPGEYLALSNGDRGSIVSPNSRRKRRNRRRNKDHVASEGPPRGKDNFKRTQPNVKTAKPVKRAIDAKRGLHLGGTGTPGRTGGWNVGTSTAGTTRTGEPPVNVEIRDVSGLPGPGSANGPFYNFRADGPRLDGNVKCGNVYGGTGGYATAGGKGGPSTGPFLNFDGGSPTFNVNIQY